MTIGFTNTPPPPLKLRRNQPTPPCTPLKGGIISSAFSEISKGGIIKRQARGIKQRE